MSNLLQNAYDKTKELYLLHVRQHVIDLYNSGKPIDYEAWRTMYLNTYEHNLLITRLTDDAYAKFLENYLKNAALEESDTYSKIPSTYNDCILQKIIHQLLNRFNRLLNEKQSNKPQEQEKTNNAKNNK